MLVTLALTALVFGVDASWSRVPLAIPVAVVGALALGRHRAALRGDDRPLQAGAGRRVRAGGDLARRGLLLPGRAAAVVAAAGRRDVQPFTPAVDLLRHLLVGQPLRASAWGDVAKLVGFSAVLLPLGLGGALRSRSTAAGGWGR